MCVGGPTERLSARLLEPRAAYSGFLGNGSHINQFKDHDSHRLTTLPAGRRSHPRRRLAFAQAANPETTPGHAEPTAPAQNLSKKLNQSNGVIHPKEVDPAIEKPVPKVGDPNVVPPSETSGGASAPQPK
jgi:hypothetical protein